MFLKKIHCLIFMFNDTALNFIVIRVVISVGKSDLASSAGHYTIR